MKHFKYIFITVCLVFIASSLWAQGGPSAKQDKIKELNTLLKSKGWTISDIARYIPYNIVMVDASFNSWLKTKEIVFYKSSDGQNRAVMPSDVDSNIKAGYKDEITLDLPDGYLNTWKEFFAERCRKHGTAEYILKDYQDGKLSFDNCINQIKAAEDINSYSAYMQDFVLYAIQKEPQVWKSLYASLSDISKKSKKVGLCLAAMLCRTTNDPAKWITIWKQVPVNKFYYGCGEETYKSFKSYDIRNGINKTKGEYGGCLSGINTYFDGRVAMRSDSITLPINTLKYVEKETYCLDKYKNQGYTFLYNPKGDCLYGFLMKKDDTYYKLQPTNPTLWGTDEKHFNAEQYSLCAGYTLNEKGEITGESFLGNTLQGLMAEMGKKQIGIEEINNAVEEYKSVQAAKEAQAADENFMDRQIKQLIPKYGEKAVWAMSKFSPYQGMPSGILDEFMMVLQGVKFKMWKQVLDRSWPGQVYRLGNMVPVSRDDDIIVYCYGGKVQKVIHKGRM